MSEPTTVQLTEQDPAYSPPQDSASTEPGTVSEAPSAPASASGYDHKNEGRLSDLKAALGPLQPTVIDAQGVERIVGPAVRDGWKPAPVEPDPEEQARLAAVAEQHAAWREERLGATQVAGGNLGDGAEVTKAAFAAERGA